MKRKFFLLSFLFIFFSMFLVSCSLLNGLMPTTTENVTPTTNQNTTPSTKVTESGNTTEPVTKTEPTPTTTNTTEATTTSSPKLVVHTDDVLVYDDIANMYKLNVFVGDTYNLNVDMGGYTGTDYMIVYNNSSEYLSISSEGLLKAKTIGDYTYVTSQFYIQLKKGSLNIEQVKVEAKITYKTYDVTLAFAKEDMLYDKKIETHWFFNLPLGETYKIKPIISGITDYKIVYSVYDRSVGKLSVTNDGVVNALATSDTNENILIKIYDKYDKLQYQTFIMCFINGNREGDNIDYLEAELSLPLKDDVVKVEKVSNTYYDYKITIPYKNMKYEIPAPVLSGVTEGYTVSYETNKDWMRVEKDDNKFFIISDSDFTGTCLIDALAKNSKGEKITSLKVEIFISNLGRGEFSIFEADSNVKLVNNSQIDLFENEVKYLSPRFNNLTYIINSNDFAFVDTANAIYHVDSTPIAVRLYGDKAGTENLKFTYSHTDASGTKYDYELNLVVKVYKRKLVDLKILDEEALRYSTGKLAINTKIIALYEGDYEVKVNGNKNLTYVIQDTLDENIKKIIFTFTDNDITKSVEAFIDTTKADAYTKVDLSTNYYDMYVDSLYNIKSTPATGEAKALIIPVWFSDSTDFINLSLTDLDGKNALEQVLEDLNTVLFGTGINENNYYSLTDFYSLESMGALNITGKISNWCTTTHSYKEYNWLNSTSGLDSKNLADEAVAWYFENNPSESYADYDKNEDGIIDALMIFYGSPYIGDPQTDAEYIQANRSFVSGRRNDELHYNRFSFIPAYEMYDLDPKTAKDDLKVATDLSKLSGGLKTNVIIHEFGHLLGLVDYYDEYMSNNSPAGGFTMQDHNYGSHDPYSIMALGWVSPYVFDSSNYEVGYTVDIKLNEFQDSGDLIVLTPSWNDTVFDEYLIIELFNPTDLNSKYPAYANIHNYGIRLWHVNAKIGDRGHIYSNMTAPGAEDNTDYNLLHYIRNDESSVYGVGAKFIADDTLFYEGDSFDMATFNSQFIEDAKLDSLLPLGWEFSVTSITNEKGNVSAVITLRRV